MQNLSAASCHSMAAEYILDLSFPKSVTIAFSKQTLKFFYITQFLEKYLPSIPTGEFPNSPSAMNRQSLTDNLVFFKKNKFNHTIIAGGCICARFPHLACVLFRKRNNFFRDFF